ncbi:MAG: Hsp70 family protein [Armatimonadetes bacterium]|nr:Hsp70 family protein [Armatimonadota bacterium]
MPGRLAVDFGTSNTVVAVWDETQRAGVPLFIPDYGQSYEHGGERISVVPSLIHYAPDRRRWIGSQVLQQNLYHSPRTFRWMKRYIAHRSPARVRIDGRDVSHLDAGQDFLSTVLTFAAAEINVADEEIALTLPVEAYEHYEDWLTNAAEAARMPRFRVIDEPSAAALGYGAHIQPGDVYLIFDFGGGTLDVAVVLIEEADQAASGRRCRVLGKAGLEVGGAVLDHWLFQEVLRRAGRSDADEDVRKISRQLLVECERLKERLSSQERDEITVMDPDTGAVLAAEFTRSQLETLLDEHDLFAQMDQTIRRAINAARERGFAEEQVKSVLLVGGSSLIPSVQRTVQRIFGRERVLLHRPLDAVARGAAAFIAGVDFYDHIQHDYAIRFINSTKGDYDYRPIIRRGTPYPTPEPIARMRVKATYDGQAQLGIAIFEVGERRQHGGGQPLELVYDPSGAARVVQVAPDEEERRARFWMNEESPTFLAADPPARRGEPRFEVEFSVDGNKRLLITARDLATGRLAHRDYPVVKLS